MTAAAKSLKLSRPHRLAAVLIISHQYTCCSAKTVFFFLDASVPCCTPALLRNRVCCAVVFLAIKYHRQTTALHRSCCTLCGLSARRACVAGGVSLKLVFLHAMQMFTSRHVGSGRARVVRPVRNIHISTQPMSLHKLRFESFASSWLSTRPILSSMLSDGQYSHHLQLPPLRTPPSKESSVPVAPSNSRIQGCHARCHS